MHSTEKDRHSRIGLLVAILGVLVTAVAVIVGILTPSIQCALGLIGCPAEHIDNPFVDTVTFTPSPEKTAQITQDSVSTEDAQTNATHSALESPEVIILHTPTVDTAATQEGSVLSGNVLPTPLKPILTQTPARSTPQPIAIATTKTKPAHIDDSFDIIITKRVSESDDRQIIHLVKSSSGEQIAVGPAILSLGAAVWSTDHKRIAFTAPTYKNGEHLYLDGRPDYSIYVMNRDGTNIYWVTSGVDGSSQISWNREGTKFVYGCFRKRWHICKIKSDGTDEKQITYELPKAVSQLAVSPVWSPNGAQVAFLRNYTEQGMSRIGQLVTINANTTYDQVEYSGDSIYVFDGLERLDWQPKGYKILFPCQYTAATPYTSGYYCIFDLSKRKMTYLQKGAYTPDFRAVWSRKGDEIAIQTQSENRIYKADIDGTNRRLLLQDVLLVSLEDW